MEDRGKQSLAGPWAARLPAGLISAAAALRLIPGVLSCVAGGELWLRGDGMNPQIEQLLNRLAPTGRFTVLPGGELIPQGCQLPHGYLPLDATWTPLVELTRPHIESAALPASAVPPVRFKLHRGSKMHEANVMVTSLRNFADYANGAPGIRLNRLRFAADATRALIWGDPLPPLPGERYTEFTGIAVPCGFEWQPRIDPSSLRQLLALEEGDLALLAINATCERIPAASFVRASRSAIRFTVGSLGEAAK